MIETLTPRLLINRPNDAVVMPLPTDETTPPVTKMYLGIWSSSKGHVRRHRMPPNQPVRRLHRAAGSRQFAATDRYASVSRLRSPARVRPNARSRRDPTVAERP